MFFNTFSKIELKIHLYWYKSFLTRRRIVYQILGTLRVDLASSRVFILADAASNIPRITSNHSGTDLPQLARCSIRISHQADVSELPTFNLSILLGSSKSVKHLKLPGSSTEDPGKN